MKRIEDETYEKWLTTIANTRLIYNTMGELENMLDNHSIHSNGIKRCFYTSQKLRAAFRDLKCEVSNMTEDRFDLEFVMEEYEKAWMFYTANLARRADPQTVVLELLRFCYPTLQENEKLGKKKQALFECILDEEINIPFLILLILKAIPGYKSKEGDITEMSRQYDVVINLLDTFTSGGSFFSSLPTIMDAKGERNKSCLMLFFHVDNILTTYEAFATPDQMYKTSTLVKENSVDLELDGYWKTDDGSMLSTEFWKIEHADGFGQYFATHWQKSSDMKITAACYTLFLTDRGDRRLTAYMLHPKAISHKIKGQSYEDEDNAWYTAEMPNEKQPLNLSFQRLLFSSKWPSSIKLSKVTDKNIIDQFDRWIEKDCEVIKPFENYEYQFRINLYAVTRTALYILAEDEGWYYRVPIDAAPGLDRIKLSDYVGIMEMGSKSYLVFDELMLFIGITTKMLAKYGIKKVNCII